MTPDERARIDAQIAASNRPRRIEDVLGEATTLLSGLSHCAGVVLTPKINARLKHIEFVNLAPGPRAGHSGGRGRQRSKTASIEVPPGLPPSAFIRASNYLSTRFQGKTIAEVQRFVREEMERLRRELDDVSARIVEAGIAIWSGEHRCRRQDPDRPGPGQSASKTPRRSTIWSASGASSRISKTRRNWSSSWALAEAGEGVRIFIGSENKLFSLSGSSLIVAPYKNTEEKIVGVLGIIGPTRMNYARIVPMVDYTARVVGPPAHLIFGA